MIITASRIKPRPTAARPKTIETKFFPSPRRGLMLAENVANQSPEGALVLENWICTPTGVRVRGGTAKRYTLDDPVISMWEYIHTSGARKFAATETDIFDLTAVADPDTVPTSVLTGQTSGYYVGAHMGTVAGQYMIVVNGTDDAILLDGATLMALNSGSTPAFTGVDTDKLSHVWTYANRFFFVEKGTMNSWYLPVDSISGAALKFSLAGVFQLGGELLFGARWSLDSGAGLNAKCVFVSSKGEVAVYEGTDPASPTNWALAGLYRIADPVGLQGHVQAGGDLLIATEGGITPMSQVISKDLAALSASGVTANIEPLWRDEMSIRKSEKLELVKWSAKGLLILSLPNKGAFVANVLTGAWSTFNGLDVQCMTTWGTKAYFGSAAGKIYEMEVGGSDDGALYTAKCAAVFDHLGAPGYTKRVTMGRMMFRTLSPVQAKLTCAKDYNTDFPAAPASPTDYTTISEWDVSEWDEGIWDATTSLQYRSGWVGVKTLGATVSWQVQLTYGVTPLPRAELVSVELAYQPADAIN